MTEEKKHLTGQEIRDRQVAKMRAERAEEKVLEARYKYPYVLTTDEKGKVLFVGEKGYGMDSPWEATQAQLRQDGKKDYGITFAIYGLTDSQVKDLMAVAKGKGDPMAVATEWLKTTTNIEKIGQITR